MVEQAVDSKCNETEITVLRWIVMSTFMGDPKAQADEIRLDLVKANPSHY